MLVVTASIGGTLIALRRHAAYEPGVAMNEQLTAVTGAILLVLTVALAVTIARIIDLLPVHYFVGFLMVGPLGLKMATTGYRFARYYLRDAAYRAIGPPPILLRLNAMVGVPATFAVFGTGIELWAFGYRYGSWWYQAHILSYLVWTLFLAIHLLGHTRQSAAGLRDELAGRDRDRALSRRGVVIGSVVLGAVLALASLTYVSPFPGPVQRHYQFGAGPARHATLGQQHASEAARWS